MPGSPTGESGGTIPPARPSSRRHSPRSRAAWARPSAGHRGRPPPAPLAPPPAFPFRDRGFSHFRGRGSARRRLGVPADPRGRGFLAGRSRRRLGLGEFPVQPADERADEPSIAAEVPHAPGARSRTEIHPRLRLRVESDTDHHVARAAGKAPPRKSLNDAFLLVPPASMPAGQLTANEVEGGLPYPGEGNGVGAAHETPIGGVGRRSGRGRQKRALETIGKGEFLIQPVLPGRPGWRNGGSAQRFILRWSASEFHSILRFPGFSRKSRRATA